MKKSKSNIRSINKINRDITDAKRSGRDIKNISDGQYTFDEYTDIRDNLFLALCNAYPDLSWKYKIDNPNYFIAGINSPDGVITFQLKMEYWDELNAIEINTIPKIDNYNVEDVKVRLKSLKER